MDFKEIVSILWSLLDDLNCLDYCFAFSMTCFCGGIRFVVHYHLVIRGCCSRDLKNLYHMKFRS